MDARLLIAILEDAGYEPKRHAVHGVIVVDATNRVLQLGTDLCAAVANNAENNNDLQDAVDTVAALSEAMLDAQLHCDGKHVIWALPWPPGRCPSCRNDTLYDTTAQVAKPGDEHPHGPEVPVRACSNCEFIEEA